MKKPNGAQMNQFQDVLEQGQYWPLFDPSGLVCRQSNSPHSQCM